MAVVLLPLPGEIDVARGNDKPARKNLSEIQPPGGIPVSFGGPGKPITLDGVEKARRRLEAAPAADLDKWVAELERIIDTKLESDLAKQACRTLFVSRMSLAFDNDEWNSKAADNFLRRAQTMPASEAQVWKDAFETLLKKEIGQTADAILDGGPSYAVPLVLIPVDAVHKGQKYNAELGRKYLARLKQLALEDVALWKAKVDQFAGTDLYATVNIILLDDFFDKEQFQRDKFKAASESGK
jgi:hypothetical protein